MTAKSIPELDLLAPRDPALDDNSDAWPELSLSNVSVYLPNDPNTPASLLHASAYYPLTLTGALEPLPKEQAHLLRQPTLKRAPTIDVSEVKTYSYGQYENGDIGFWAAGKAGWHQIKPARSYRAVFNEMIEGVRTLYFLADAYRQPRRRGKGKISSQVAQLGHDELFAKMAAEMDGLAKSIELAQERIYKHREFLFSSMLSGKEGLDWSKNPMYLHLCTKFPGDYRIVSERLLGPQAKTRRPAKTSQQYARPPSVSSKTSSLKRKRGRPPKNRPNDAISIGSSSAASSAMNYAQLATEDARPAITPLTTLKASQRTRQDSSVSLASIAETPEQESQPKPLGTRQYRDRFYSGFTDCNCAIIGYSRLSSLNQHIDREHAGEVPARPASEDIATPMRDSDEEPPHRAQKGRSALRPKASKANKGAYGGGKAPIEMAGDSDDTAEQSRSPTAAGKRKFSEASNNRHRRRRSSKQDLDEGIDMASSPAPSDSSSAVAGAPTSPPSELARRLKHEPDQIQEDTWLCALDGCTHKVYLASKPDSQRLIREHYALHAYDDDQRVQMVKRLQEPSLPVNHLMERVRLQAKADGFPGSRYAGMGLGGANEVSRFPALPVLRY